MAHETTNSNTDTPETESQPDDVTQSPAGTPGRAVVRSIGIGVVVLLIAVVSFALMGDPADNVTNDLSVFTEDVMREYDLELTDLPKIQFYTSEDLTLERTVTTLDDTRNSAGKLKRETQQLRATIEVPEHTPVLCFSVDSYERLVIGLESDVYVRFLYDDYDYSLQGDTVSVHQRSNTVVSKPEVGVTYNITDGAPRLLVDLSRLSTLTEQRRELRGLRLPEGG